MEDEKPQVEVMQNQGNVSEGIHTMPKSFVKVEKKSSASLVIIVVVLGVGLVGAIVALLVFLSPSQEMPQVAVNTTQPEQKTQDTTTQPEASQKEDAQPEQDTTQQEESTTQLPPITASELRPGRDSDGDGLTDLEESVYGTQMSLADTDGDGHSDSVEILNLYNPVGVAPAFLIESGLVRAYEDTNIGYSLYYPTRWTARSLSPDNTEVRFTSGSGEFIQLKIYENPENKPILAWYAEQNPTVDTSVIENVTSKDGLRGIKSIDGLTIYLVRPLRQTISGKDTNPLIFAFTYSPGISTRYEYKTTFDMMLNSFMLMTAKDEANQVDTTTTQSEDASL